MTVPSGRRIVEYLRDQDILFNAVAEGGEPPYNYAYEVNVVHRFAHIPLS